MTTLLTSQQMQELMNVDRSTVYRMAEDGRLPGIKIGRQWRFPADRVAAVLGLAVPAPGATPAAVEDPATEPMPQDLADLIQPEIAQSVADLVGELFGVMAVITDMDGRPLTSVANPCGYYAAVASHPGAAESCLAQWRMFAGEPHVAPRWVRTHLGFLCARTFVWVDLRPVGMIVVGGVTPPSWPPPEEDVEAIADDAGVQHRVLLDAVDQTWSIAVEEQHRILRLLPQMGDLVSHLASARQQIANQMFNREGN